MNRIYFLLLAGIYLCCTSCKLIKAHMNQKVYPTPGTRLYFSDEAFTKVTIEVEQKEQEFVIDLGSPFNAFNFNVGEQVTRALLKFPTRGFRKGSGFHVKRLIVVDTLYCPMFNVSNPIALYQVHETNYQPQCRPAVAENILGAKCLIGQYPLYINYQEGYLQFADTLYDRSGFTEVPCVFDRTELAIGLVIQGRLCYFDFDTGNRSEKGLILVGRDAVSMEKQVCYVEKSLVLDVYKNMHELEWKIYQNEAIGLGKHFGVYSAVAVAGNQLHHNNAGHEFLKHFNWIIDARNKKVFCHLINSSLSTPRSKKQGNACVVGEVNGQLIVGQAIPQFSSYHIGDTVVAVGQQKIGTGNICSMMQLLNESSRWDTLSVEVASFRKKKSKRRP